VPAIDLVQLSKSFGRTPVLSGASLAIEPGELCCLLGPSGCGKTTLLRLAAGFLAPDAGRVHVAGQDVTRLPPERRGLGMVFQSYALWPHLDVAANVAFPLEMRDVAPGERRARVEAALALVELPGLGARRIHELSGGQQQRVALARAIVARPRLLLLDEPLSNLDPRLRSGMRDAILRVCRSERLTALYVTHDRGEAFAIADRIAVMGGGRILQHGSPRELHRAPNCRFVASFLGDANLIPATVLDASRVRCALGDLIVPGPLPDPGTAVWLCLRPERLWLGGDGWGARVLGATWQGSHCLVRVLVDGIELDVWEPDQRERRPGDHLGLRFHPGDVVVLTA
jgi:iron(III) transport system ATP-binding protein